jgi:hypothetical protein
MLPPATDLTALIRNLRSSGSVSYRRVDIPGDLDRWVIDVEAAAARAGLDVITFRTDEDVAVIDAEH